MNKNFKNKNLKAKRKITKTNKGITLIALIITIIVLLILAVVAIRAVTGDGILAHAKNARDKWDEATAEEEAMLGNLTNYITEQSGNNPASGETYPKVKVGEKAETNGTINGETPSANNPVIPVGFAPINTDTSSWGDGNSAPKEQDVKNGLVISDATTADDGNEFVWIPVPNLGEFAIPKPDVSEKDKNGRVNYIGVLYTFNSDKSQNTTRKWSSNGNREPDNLDSSYDSTTNLSEWTNTLYQESFNAMVESIAKYKGFYVGRYEMSEADGKAQSKKGAESLKNTTAENNWYRLYSKAKTYAEADSSVTSEMIWGCQYDAMMRWMQENGIDVTSASPKDTGRSDGGTTSKNTGTNTGNQEKDRLNNVYDLLGNRYEWTQEANVTSVRVVRGGDIISSLSPCYRNNYNLTDGTVFGHLGSRLSLYVK